VYKDAGDMRRPKEEVTLRRTRRPLTVRAAVLGACGALLLALAVPETALALAHDGTDPHGTGCDANGTVYSPSHVTSVDGFGSLLELRFSTGCSTAWARFTCHAANDCFNYVLDVTRSNGTSESMSIDWPWAETCDGCQLYTLQLFDGVGYTAQACYTDEHQGIPRCTSKY